MPYTREPSYDYSFDVVSNPKETIMREATITLPVVAHHTEFREELIALFGGFSEHRVLGAWRDPDTEQVMSEENIRYIIGMDDTPLNEFTLRTLAQRYGQSAHQISVYITLPNGRAELIYMPKG